MDGADYFAAAVVPIPPPPTHPPGPRSEIRPSPVGPRARRRLPRRAAAYLGVAAAAVVLGLVWRQWPQGPGDPTPIQLPSSIMNAQLQDDANAQNWQGQMTPILHKIFGNRVQVAGFYTGFRQVQVAGASV